MIIATIIATIAYIRFTSSVEKARGAEAYTVLADITTSENRYFLENSSWTNNFAFLDSYVAAPISPGNNFTYSVPNTGATTAYAQAARTSATGGRQSYGMCFASGKRLSCAAAVCNPGCP